MVAARTPDSAVYQATSAVIMPSQPPIWIHVVPLLPARYPMVKARKVRNKKKNTAMRAPVSLNVARNIKKVKMVHPRTKTPSAVLRFFPSERAIPVGGKRIMPTASQNPP